MFFCIILITLVKKLNYVIIYLKYIYFILSVLQINIFINISLKTYRYKIIIKLYLEDFLIAQYTFLNIKPKMCFNMTIDKDI